MEPTDLKPILPDDAALEAWLRANSALPPLADSGFSKRVLATLPRTSRWRMSRSWFCLGGLALGSMLALAGVIASGHTVTDDLFVSFNNPLAAPPALVALVVALSSSWYAYRDHVRVRLLPRW
jgi:hypothetical protein